MNVEVGTYLTNSTLKVQVLKYEVYLPQARIRIPYIEPCIPHILGTSDP